MGVSLHTKDLCCQLFGCLFISGNVWVEELLGESRLTSGLVFHCMDLYPIWRSRVTLLDRVECQP